jgi:hypothetical protein
MKLLAVLCFLALYMQSLAIKIGGNMDYINSGYHIKIAEVEYAYLKGEKREAYNIFQKTEKVIPIVGYKEMQCFVELSLLYENYPKAYEYICKLIDYHGYKISDFEKYENFKKLKNKKFYNAESLVQAERDFIADTALWQQLNKMFEYDQSCRILLVSGDECYRKDRDSLCCLYYMEQLPYIDSVNYYQLLNIIEKTGYPLSKDKKYFWWQRQDVENALVVLTLHIADVPSYVEKMKNILLECIKSGDCSPYDLARLIDKQCSINRQPSVYGYLEDSPIYDVQNLEKRRTEIGIPSRKLLCEIEKLKSKQPHPEFFELLKTLPQYVQDAFNKNTNTPCNF